MIDNEILIGGKNVGAYTGLRCKIIVKEKYRLELNRLFTNDLDWCSSKISLFERYGYFTNADGIPHGTSRIPIVWENETDGFDMGFNKENGYWSFQCALKNYDDTIGYFIENILSEIVESIIHLEMFYEEWSYSKSYKLIDGECIIDDNYFRKYGYC